MPHEHNINFIPGQRPGWDLNGDGIPDLPPGPLTGYGGGAHTSVRPRGAQEIRQLNQYQGFFSTQEGDFPVTVVANSIKEAAKILTMPGVFGNDVTEPTLIKFLKGKVAVSVPVHHVGFNTVIEPKGAIESGAYATPGHAEVHNGTEVIFTAFEPFGWKFLGWFKGDLCLSTEKVAYIDVYDPYSTLVQFVAKYEFDPKLRNGRYIELGKNRIFDFDFYADGHHPEFKGRLILETPNVGPWFLMLKGLTSNEMNLETDKSVTQPSEPGITFHWTATPIGINLTVTGVTVDNPWGMVMGEVIPLRWINKLT